MVVNMGILSPPSFLELFSNPIVLKFELKHGVNLHFKGTQNFHQKSCRSMASGFYVLNDS